MSFSRSVVQQLQNVTFHSLNMYENRVLRICGTKGMEITKRRVRLFGLILSNKCYQNNQIHEEWIREELNVSERWKTTTSVLHLQTWRSWDTYD